MYGRFKVNNMFQISWVHIVYTMQQPQTYAKSHMYIMVKYLYWIIFVHQIQFYDDNHVSTIARYYDFETCQTCSNFSHTIVHNTEVISYINAYH